MTRGLSHRADKKQEVSTPSGRLGEKEGGNRESGELGEGKEEGVIHQHHMRLEVWLHSVWSADLVNPAFLNASRERKRTVL